MFTTELQDFGSGKKITISHKSGIRAEILPEYGAALNGLYIPTRNQKIENIIDGYLSDDEPQKTGTLYKGVFLFPFPNRLKDGQWKYKGKELQFPINEPSRNNALHGILYNQKFEIIDLFSSSEFGSAHLRYNPIQIPQYYPFKYQIDIEFILTESDGLTVKTQVQNLSDEAMPFGLGWHPYFRTGNPIDSIVLNMSDIKSLEVDSQMIPKGPSFTFRMFDFPNLIKETFLDTGFEILKPDKFEVQIFDEDKKLKFNIWQHSNEDGFSYLQVYTPPDRKSIAIEPMTSRANALQDNEGGIQNLAPGGSQSYVWGVSF